MMRLSICLLVALFMASQSTASAQYDFDDFLQAVESGKSKAATPTRITHIAQLNPSDLPEPTYQAGELLEAPSELEARELPNATQLQTPEPDPIDDRSTGSSATPTPAPSVLAPPSPIEDSTAPLHHHPSPVPMDTTLDSPLSPCESNAIDFEDVFQQQSSCDSGMSGTCGSGCKSCNSVAQKSCVTLPYQQPILPAPSTLRGYFNASPQVVNLWDGYACEVAAQCHKGKHLFKAQCGQPTGRVYECDPICGSCSKSRCD